MRSHNVVQLVVSRLKGNLLSNQADRIIYSRYDSESVSVKGVDSMLKVCFHLHFQGSHFRCTQCLRVPNYQNKYDVRRHLQDQQSVVGLQFSLCGYLFNRRSMRHSCNVGEEDI